MRFKFDTILVHVVEGAAIMNRTLRVAGAALIAASVAGTAHASLLGKEMEATYRFPDLGSVYAFAPWSPPTFTVGAGTETTGNVENVTWLVTDFTATSLLLTFDTVLTNPTWNAAAFNGPVFSLTSGTLGIVSANVDGTTTMAGFDDSRVTVTDTEIRLDWNGLSYVDGTTIAISFTFDGTAVPEPGALALLAFALGGLIIASRRPAPAGA